MPRQLYFYVVSLTVLATACGAARSYQSAPAQAVAATAPAAPKPLERSVFSRSPEGQISEEELQKILAAPIDLELPARVGVLGVTAATDWRGPSPSYDMAPAAMGDLTKALRKGELFTLVTEMISIPSGALGMEALRELAARYKLRYILLYRERLLDDTTANEWAWGYATVVGALFLPGASLHVHGYVQASLFDVKTGLLLFTVRRRVKAEETSNIWHHDEKIATLRRSVATHVATELASDIRRAADRFEHAAKLENARKATIASQP
ncbi:MAG TPA: hypothetical protein VFG83_07490 [Kofleriaceae bacterium]|nr:hypothetical protein [Kofleriaceae bacterium]